VCAVKKKILSKHKTKWVTYSEEHKDKLIEDFRSYIFFTDEALVDPTSRQASRILRERGKQYNDKNTVKTKEKRLVKFH
jgi:hypothetical protein